MHFEELMGARLDETGLAQSVLVRVLHSTAFLLMASFHFYDSPVLFDSTCQSGAFVC
jgi:hypothetical protein